MNFKRGATQRDSVPGEAEVYRHAVLRYKSLLCKFARIRSRTNPSKTDIMKASWNKSRIAHWVFTVFLMMCLVGTYLKKLRDDYRLLDIYGTTNYYVDILQNAEYSDPQEIVNYMVYSYTMNKTIEPSSKKIYGMISERMEHFAMLAIARKLKEMTGKDFGTDFDAWVENFADEEHIRSYHDSKGYRLGKGIPANPLECKPSP